MKFLCVGYFDQEKMSALSPAQLESVMGECPPFMDEFYASGKVPLVAGIPGVTKSLRRVGGKVQITDGSDAGSHEAIGCVFIVEAADLAEAIQVAALHPTTRINAGERLGFRIGLAPIHYFEERPTRRKED